MTAPLSCESILGTTGRIAQRLKSYEQRPEQLQMAQAVAQAIAAKTHLVVEAGTGVGKSFAYLVPAILAATAGQVKDANAAAAAEKKTKRPATTATRKNARGSLFRPTPSVCKSRSSAATFPF